MRYDAVMAEDAAEQLIRNRASLERSLHQLDALAEPLQHASDLLKQRLLAGSKMLCCGNGGSAADAAHFSSEVAGRYRLHRAGYPALDLSAEHTLVTALSNDYPPEEVFARQVHTFGQAGDVLVGFSTSGCSENVRRALLAARQGGLHTIGFLGGTGGTCLDLVDIALLVPAEETPRVQELHLLLYHTICQMIDPALAAGCSTEGARQQSDRRAE
jgi:D-sedoheptulose 7-phosphate isomerase